MQCGILECTSSSISKNIDPEPSAQNTRNPRKHVGHNSTSAITTEHRQEHVTKDAIECSASSLHVGTIHDKSKTPGGIKKSISNSGWSLAANVSDLGSVRNKSQPPQNCAGKEATSNMKQRYTPDTLYVEGLHSQFPDDISDEVLADHFSAFKDDITAICIVPGSKKSKGKCYGLITFSSTRVASKAQKKYNGTHLRKKYQIRVTHVKSCELPLTIADPVLVQSEHMVQSKSDNSTITGNSTSVSLRESMLLPSTEEKLLPKPDPVKECDAKGSTASMPGQILCGEHNATGVKIENLSPLIGEDEVKAVILNCGVKILSFDIHPDPSAPNEACIANVSLANHSQVATVISRLHGKMILGRVCSATFATNEAKERLQVMVQREISRRVYRFICFSRHAQVEEFKVNGGGFDYKNGKAIVSSPDKDVLMQFLSEVVDKCTERRLNFKPSTWSDLAVSKDEHVPSLLDKAKSSYSAEAESDVYIVPQIDLHRILFVGTHEGVDSAQCWLFSQLYREFKVESDTMQALVMIYPHFDSELSDNFHVKILNYSKESTVITIEGDGTNVQKAHQKIDALISKFCIAEVEFGHSLLLLESASKRIKENGLKVSVKAMTAASQRSSVHLKVSSFIPRQLERATGILTGNLTYKSFKIPASVSIGRSALKNVQAAVSKEFQVSVCPKHKGNERTSLLISGFIRSDVIAAYESLQDKLSGFVINSVQPPTCHHKKENAPLLVC